MLSQEQIAFYNEAGYLAVENVLSQEDILDLRRVTDDFVEQSRAFTEHTDVFDLEPGHTPEAPRLRRLKNPILHHPVYDRMLRHPKILDIVADLIGPGIRTNGNKLNLKSPEFGSPVEWHQDWVFYPHTNDDLLAVGVCMDDMMLINGCLLVVPGSHKGPVYSHHEEGHFVGAVSEDFPGADNAVPLEVRAGGITIHHARTLHASATNKSAYSRRLLLFQYCAVDAWPLSGSGEWDKFNANILRGEPTNRPRLADVPVLMPMPPALKGGSIYETQTTLKKKMFAG
jgi:phytanoyl-CoA hydroxylase